jgi:hypothetical protein
MLRPSSIRSGIGLAFIRVTRPLRRPPQRSADARPLVHLIQIPWGRQPSLAVHAKAVPAAFHTSSAFPDSPITT